LKKGGFLQLKKIKILFDKHPNLAVLVYKEKFIYANKTALKLLGLTNDEILQLSPQDIIANPKDKILIEKIAKKRIKGKFFPKIYNFLQVTNKNEEYKLVKFFTQTIQLDDNSYTGFVIGEDVTSEIKKEILLNILNNINKSIITINNEEQLFKKVNEVIFNFGNFDLVSTSLKDKINYIKPTYFKGNYTKEFLSHLPIFSKIDEFNKNEIIFINDLENTNLKNKEKTT
jgi:PAS domain S-box-containing protein